MSAISPAIESPDDYTLPALLPPHGVSSNFVHPTSRAKDLIITSVICISLMVICVSVRFYTKLHIKNAWGWDDCETSFCPNSTLTDNREGLVYLLQYEFLKCYFLLFSEF